MKPANKSTRVERLNMKTKTAYDFPVVGCYIDESSGSASDCNRRTIEFAIDYGFEPNPEWETEGDDYEFLSDIADEAVSFLNDLETRSFMYWTFEDNSLFLIADVDSARDDVGFVTGQNDGMEYPEDDYQGEWLHVSDHGNATLYVRENGKDREIWGGVRPIKNFF